MVNISPTISIINFNENSLNIANKDRDETVTVKKKKDTTICCLEETLSYKDTNRLKVKRCRKIYHANTNQKKAGVTILIFNKADFKARKTTVDEKEQYIMLKGVNFPKICKLCVYT